jgi:DNA-binding transcriptional regulator GbsR (MarR family)
MMAEGRMLKKEISDSEKLGRLKQKNKARVLYFMMYPHLDVQGRLNAKPRHIKGRITTELEYSEKTIQNALKALHEVGLIVLYRKNGNQYVQYTRFHDFQKINPDKEAKSKIPPPTLESSRVTPNNSALSESESEVKAKVKLKKSEEKQTQKISTSLLSLSTRYKKRLKEFILPATQADTTFLSLLERELFKQGEPDNYKKVLKIASRSRKAKKPIAYFRSVIEKELGIKV